MMSVPALSVRALSRATVSGATLSGATLSGASMPGARHRDRSATNVPQTHRLQRFLRLAPVPGTVTEV
jgi:hypothetical protein